MYYSWIVHQLSNIELLILLSIFASRKEFIFAQDICEELFEVTTIVNSTVVLYCILSDNTEFNNNSAVISWKPLHSENSTILENDISRRTIFNGERMNTNYNSTHFVNTSLPDQYDLVITNVQLQHAGKYFFQRERGQKIKCSVLSVYENLPSCEIEDESRLICNISYSGVRTPELLCNITTFKEDTINKTYNSFANAAEPPTNGIDFAINISLPGHNVDTSTLNCIIRPSVKHATEDWSFLYEWPKATDELESSARHSTHETKELDASKTKTDSVPFTSEVSVTEREGIPNWMTNVAASIVGAIVLLANVVIFSIIVIRQKRFPRNNVKSNLSDDCSEIPTHKRNASVIRSRHQSSSLEHGEESAYEHILEIGNASMVRSRHQSSSLEYVGESAYEHILETDNASMIRSDPHSSSLDPVQEIAYGHIPEGGGSTYTALTTQNRSFDSATYAHSCSIGVSKDIDNNAGNTSMIRSRNQSSSPEHFDESASDHFPETGNTYTALTTHNRSFDSATYAQLTLAQ